MEIAPPLVENGRAVSPAPLSNVVFKPMKPELILDYLERLLITTLGATRDDLETPGSLLSKADRADTLTRCARFANEGQEVLYIQKDAVEDTKPEILTTNGVNGHGVGKTNGEATDASEEDEEESEQRFTYRLLQDPSFSNRTTASIAILKKPLPLDASFPITSQISIINLPGVGLLDKVATVTGSSPYETLHSIIHNAIAPFFNAYAQRQNIKTENATRYDPEGKTGVTSTKKKLAELELSLLHLHQNVEIPELYLPVHQVVQDTLSAAHAKGIKATPSQISMSFLTDSRFLNDLQSSVNAWVKSIQTITKLSRDVESGSARQEINFWLSMETRLNEIGQQLQGEGVLLTKEILKQAKRYTATTSFESDTGLDAAMERTQKYNQMMRDFPLDELLSAPTPEKLETALDNVFQHVNKKSRVTQYPIARTVALLSVISGDVEAQVQTLIRSRRIMLLDYSDFRDVTTSVHRIWQTWDENVRDLTNIFRELIRRRGEAFMPIKFVAKHIKTKERLEYIEKFRSNHEQLSQTITSVLGVGKQDDGAPGKTDIGDIDAVAEVSQAYAALKDVDVLDVSDEGTQLWLQAETLYNERTARVENTIISKLRDRLATAKTANEMFRVFSKFNALLVRPKIRGAIAEYQTQLIERVKRDINALQERFKQQYGNSEARMMAQLHDVPPVSGAIIWARQIEKQLQTLMAKVEAVLGKNWDMHIDGMKLAEDSSNFQKKLDTRSVYESWLTDVDRRHISVSGLLFGVTRNRAMNNNLELFVAFDPQTVSLFREVRNLLWLNFPVPNRIGNIAREAKKVYPFSVSLGESIGVLKQTNQTIQGMADVSTLLANYEQNVQKLIETGVRLRWEVYARTYDVQALTGGEFGTQNTAHLQFIRDFGIAVETLSNKTQLLISVKDKLNTRLQALKTCSYERQIFSAHLEEIQKLVDDLNLGNFSNLEHWVTSINQTLEEIFISRLQDAINVWIEQFDNFNISASASSKQARKPDLPEFAEINSEISMKHSVIYLDPPFQRARAYWLQSFQNWLGRLCSLQKLRATRFQMDVDDKMNIVPYSFANLPSLCIDNVMAAYSAIDARCNDVNAHVSKWLQFQSLWDLQLDSILNEVGDDLAKWLQMIQEMRKERSTFDTNDSQMTFTNLVIDHENVQGKITAKYDQWQHDIVQRFGIQLGNRMTEVYADLERSRRDLEGQSLEASSTAQAVSLITAVQECKRKVETWEPEIDLFSQGQTLLNRHRQLPQDWLHVEQINHEWAIMQDVLARKLKIVEEQSDALRAQLLVEDQAISERIKQATNDWEEQKPVSGAIPPEKATATLSDFQRRFTQLKSESDMILKAKEVLDLPGNADVSIEPILEELQDFSAVWGALSSIWKRLNELREGLWTSVVPRKLRQSLEALQAGTREMPSRMRQYAAFEHVQAILKQHITANAIITDLRSDAMRERHWQKLFKTLRPNQRYSPISMTLGNVWDLQPISSESAIREVIVQAQGELTLEEYLKDVRELWSKYNLDLVNYQGKCRLIRGWDELFAKCSENLNSLQQMANSPYYKEFEEEASSWEEKLNRVHVLFDVWIDVQRQWVYLEGVFTGNADIKHLLPVESSRFQNINNEFLALMKKVGKSNGVLEVINIPGALKSLERLADLLGKIQKALGEYLERERMSFPRFYFVGDEDLLEMIGNSNDTFRIAKHFKKMFAGISGLIIEEETTITGFSSKEDEKVLLSKPISLTKTPKINDWLTLLESSMKTTLALLLGSAVQAFSSLFEDENLTDTALCEYINSFPAQIAVLAIQVVWTRETERQFQAQSPDLDCLYKIEVRLLELLASIVLQELDAVTRKKCEHIITECVHQRDTISSLVEHKASSPSQHLWEIQMKYMYTESDDPEKCLRVVMANSSLQYGFEYLGVPDRLVRTPLTDRCFLTLTQGLAQRLGGSPYGPAGTGKTESVKALGLQLGRFTLVFCCDDTFDFQAMGRIFLGICQVGAWGCFDEFNRLEERILSAVSQQVQDIQVGLKATAHDPSAKIELAGRHFKVNPNTGLFITMNPGYAGRSNLPDNLKKLFRSVAMSKPDKELIAEVMLYSQGFRNAKSLSKQTVPFFDECDKVLSKQPHYDFGLRALKSVLVSSGTLKREHLDSAQDAAMDDSSEAQIIVQSLHETISPKLIHGDALLLTTIEKKAFPGIDYIPAKLDQLRSALQAEAQKQNLVVSEIWMTKAMQLFQIQNIHHGLMMVGNSGTGKSAIWKTLLKAMQEVDGMEGVHHIIDAKVMSKEALYGSLDSTTREWTDGLFTSTLRKIVDNFRGEDSKRHWIVFDGDVDPEWVENLNSVLDDNKLLTLPNGERLNLPNNVRLMFEVETLKYATLATVSRCGMVWFNDDTVTPDMIASHYLDNLASKPFEELDDEGIATEQATQVALKVQQEFSIILRRLFSTNDFLSASLQQAASIQHIMEFTNARALSTLFSLLNKACRSVIEYNLSHEDFPLEAEQIDLFMERKLLISTVWAFTGDCTPALRQQFGLFVGTLMGTILPPIEEAGSLIDFDVQLPRAEWVSWQSQVPTIELNTHSVTQTDVVIPTLDTVRHEEIFYSWLAEHKPLVLCGPPGSGKTMSLFSSLRKLENMQVVGLNFSSATTPELILKTFDQYCEYRKTVNGVVMAPAQIGRWLVLFCDEINLPAPDKYGTQRAISFLRQLVEQQGFWRTSDRVWVSMERVQFVGACNPPTDAGRTALSSRFLRHAPVVMVDYPGEVSLNQIYTAFSTALLKVIPDLRGYAQQMTKAMVQFYLESQARFTPQIQPHYVYSPRELTRWVRGIYEAIKPFDTLSPEGLVRIWAHEALRLFQDRLVAQEERDWTVQAVHRIAAEHFPNTDQAVALQSPILFSNWLSKDYVSVDQSELRSFVKARMRTFCEEEVDVPLVLFNDVLEHVLRIDRVFRQPQGHLILIGVSGSGKTTLSRFVAWMNGLKVFQIKVHGRYTAEDFDDDLRDVLMRAGCRGEKLCFIMDESNVLDSGFLERMNTLLANAEVPGLFEGDAYAALMTACKEGAQRQGSLLDSQEELYNWFTQQIVKNLHVVFTMNPPEDGLSSKAATSPALFNRCVLDWFGDWSDQALYQVATELTQSLDLDRQDFVAPDSIPVAYQQLALPANHRTAIVNAMVHVHHSLHVFNQRLLTRQGRTTFLTPRHYLDFVSQYLKLYNEKRDDLEDQQRHLNVGLDKLKDTVEKVRDLRASLAVKKDQLNKKNKEANDKLVVMMQDQQHAEITKATAEDIRKNLEIQDRQVAERKEEVNADLAKAEPAVIEARESVSNIKKQHLTEVRSMANPPSGVKLALEAVCTLLGHKIDSWKAIQAVIRRDDFISSIVNFDNESRMTRPLRNRMQSEFLSNEDFTYEKVNRASKACGPLVQWTEAQVNYSAILDRVGPLREEADQLEKQALVTRQEAQSTESEIKKLEQSIGKYKDEYALLISETQAIKSEMERVESKVNRSVKLLDNLASERERWESGSKSFETQIGTIAGDVLVAAAFLAYAGLFDQQYRMQMISDWQNQLSMSGIQFKQHNTIDSFLATPDETLQWQADGLPIDDLCTENAVILKRYNRYPLIIDPSGRALQWLQNEHKERKITVTSFLDESFVKQLESSLRFGNPIIVQDAEHLDPVLTHVLNKEYQRTGGRVLIQLGKQEIDFSPAFRLYLFTRDPSATFPPDICSRTTFVNFTVTQSSLQTQSLNDVLKSERPDVDERRSNLIKMQGQFTVHLRGLEKRLLQALNESRGNILDDDLVIETLETLKREAAEISKKVAETRGVMAEVELITAQYSPIARACSAIFSVLESLHHLNHFYQFSLQYFTDIFQVVLHNNPHLKAETDHRARTEIIIKDIFVTTFQRAAMSLLQKDRVTLGLLLAQATPYQFDRDLLEMILNSRIAGSDISSQPESKKDALKLSEKFPSLKGFADKIPVDDWERFQKEELAEQHIPQTWTAKTSELDQLLQGLAMVKLFRLDRFVPAAEKFLVAVFGRELLELSGDLEQVIDQVTPNTPISLCASPGFDASYKVDLLVEKRKTTCNNIAMGSNEGPAAADKAISNAAANGSWVLIKNVHLAVPWLQGVEKKLSSLKPRPGFRLILSMETSNKIPVNLLRASRILSYEQPAGIRANMRDSLSTLGSRDVEKPVEKARLILLLSFLHAVIQERLRYAPTLGWKGFWEFNDADYECACFVVEHWIDKISGSRTNIGITRIPWDLLRILIRETYAGKIDDEEDYKTLTKMVDSVFVPDAFENDHLLVKPDAESQLALSVPSGTTMSGFKAWVKELPEREPPTWLGLPANAEKLILVGQARRTIEKVWSVRKVLEEGEKLMNE